MAVKPEPISTVGSSVERTQARGYDDVNIHGIRLLTECDILGLFRHRVNQLMRHGAIGHAIRGGEHGAEGRGMTIGHEPSSAMACEHARVVALFSNNCGATRRAYRGWLVRGLHLVVGAA